MLFLLNRGFICKSLEPEALEDLKDTGGLEDLKEGVEAASVLNRFICSLSILISLC